MAQIRKLEVRNFRSIRTLSWLPTAGINCLVGPGDSGKSTILDAIDFCMGARRTIQFSDADFTDLDVDMPIEITITLGGLSDRLKALDVYGLFLRGFDAESGKIEDEPRTDLETVLCLRLTVGADLEPVWTLVSDRAAALGSERYLAWSDRQDIAPTRIDSFSEVNLSWRRGSVLNKLSNEKADAAAILLAAARDARAQFGDTADEQLSEALTKVKEVVDGLGIGDGNDLHAELDPYSVSVSAGTISLHNADGIPLKRMGVGSTRLLIAGLQKEASVGSAIVLVDEVEHGLEPHRIIHFLNALGAKDPKQSLQVFMTSHSPVVVRELGLNPLTIVRRGQDGPILKRAENHPELQGTARLFPEAFLAKSVLVCEGATEVGFVRGIDQWCDNQGEGSLHAAGACLVDGGGGGDQMLSRAQAFRTLGYRSALFRDDDKRPSAAKEADFQRDGGRIFTWREGKKIEVEIFDSIPPDAVGPLLDIALEEREEQPINDQLKTVSENKVTLATVLAEIEANELSNASRQALGEASGKGWFKNISTMERVARDVIAPRAAKLDPVFRQSIKTIRKWCRNVG
jgi:predicted ATPase